MSSLKVRFVRTVSVVVWVCCGSEDRKTHRTFRRGEVFELGADSEFCHQHSVLHLDGVGFVVQFAPNQARRIFAFGDLDCDFAPFH